MSIEGFQADVEKLFNSPMNTPYVRIDENGITIDGEFQTLDQLEKFTELCKRYFRETGRCPF
jgi:hypothetical protein